MASVSEINFLEPKQSGNFKKIKITGSDGKKITTETESCFSYGIQKSNKPNSSYSLSLVLKNDSEALRMLKEILQKCKENLTERKFNKCLYVKTTEIRVYPRLKYYNGKFNTGVYENDVEIDPIEYLGVFCNARALIHIEGILLGGSKAALLLRVLEVEVSKRVKKRQLSKKP